MHKTKQTKHWVTMHMEVDVVMPTSYYLEMESTNLTSLLFTVLPINNFFNELMFLPFCHGWW